MTTSLFASDALLPDGWARNVRIDWDAAGTITKITPGAKDKGVPKAAGPVLPGMPNLHSHAFQRAMAGLAERHGPSSTDDFWTWRVAMYHLVQTLEPDDIEAIAAQLYIEMLKHGYTSVAEFHYLHHDRNGTPYSDRAELAHRVITAGKNTGIAMTLLPVIYTHGGLGHQPLNAAQKRFAGDSESIPRLLEGLIDFYAGEPHLRFGMAPHSVRAVDANTLTESIAALELIDATAPIHMHASEQRGEVQQCLETHGVTPIDWVCDIAPVSDRWTFIHATHATDREVERMVQSEVVAGLCPTTEANLGDGIFPLHAYARGGGRRGIGGDSHVSVSPFEELRALEYSQRLARHERNVTATDLQPEVATNLWATACIGGAQALGQSIGELAVGQRADLVVLDGADLDFEGLDAGTQLAVAMFSGWKNRITDVFVAGRHVIDAGRHYSEESTATAFRQVLSRLRK
ncbi:formimidoylglutamate deiminase [Usitatibacter palustris]|uniref:5'-deoxyadenosine deaminase n=1 Tax=Usitatibacter palustris TaxID=2732487 RepID=A0A6M4H7S0_9PROT|nr:formimidoylglutamate deiminase [Usitatibacter palustris]QJR14743.1 5'-deoxyadenosine deaminase [Usitatibacter palustris]